LSQGDGINAGGQVVGWANTSNGAQHAFLFTGGPITDLGTLGGASSQADAINKNSQIVGWANTATGAQDAFLLSGSTMTDLNSLVTLSQGVSLIEATGINDLGQIVANGSDGHAYLLTHN
jgi:probable HAF family extracellular repeat protein